MNNKLVQIVALLFLGGCATQKYVWDGYDNTLYAYYKDPAGREKFVEKLKETILKAEQVGKVPPGIYAEYGYTLYEDKNFLEAINYFQKEHDLWPESRFFMEKMIKNAQNVLAKQQSKEPAK